MDPSAPVRFGVLGAATIAPEAIVRPISRHDDVELVAVGAARPGAAAAFAAEHRIPVAHASYEAVLADPSIDVVYIGLAAAAHAEWVIAALEAGKHVLCEKPLALNARQADEMIATAARLDLVLLEAFHYRFHPLMTAVRRAVASGMLGRLLSVESSVQGLLPFSADSILHDPAQGGGALLHSGCYAVHWMRLLAAGEPDVVHAEARTNPLGADTTMTARLAFPGDIAGTLTASFDAASTAGPQLVVVGEQGRLEVQGLISPHRGHSITLHLDGQAPRVGTVGGRASFDYQLDALLAAVRGDREAVADPLRPAGTMAAMDAMYRAARVREQDHPA